MITPQSSAVWTLVLACALAVQAGALAPVGARARVVVMTDIGGDPDDMQSLVRYLLYACDFDTEGFCTGFGWGHRRQTRPDLIRERIAAYAKVVANLRKHRPDYPPADHLMSLVKDGHNGDPHKVGPGMNSEASDWIIKVLDKPDPRPVWFSIWGGPRELAQAIWKVSQTRSKKQLAAFKKKIRVHSIADQDRTAGWVKQHHPDVFWIYSNGLFRGIWKGRPVEPCSPQWLKENVLSGHGPLGSVYPPKAAGKVGVKEGDTPSFFYVLPDGLSDPEHPEWGNWGGRFRPSGRGREYVGAADDRDGHRDPLWTIARWRVAYQNAFEARMDWCVKPFDEANHAPLAVLNGDETRQVLSVAADPGDAVKLSADGSSDPDGDGLVYHWWVYREASTYRTTVPIEAHGARAAVTVPSGASGRTIHLILEVTDEGEPPLTAYRRAVIGVSGEAPDKTKPVTSMPPPPKETGPWAFYRGVNIGGKPVTIDGNRWDGDDAKNFACKHRRLNSTHVALIPPADAARTAMIHSFRWHRRARIRVTGVPRGRYAVYAYVWEETSPETITIALNGEEVAGCVYTGVAGEWQRLGPWYVDVTKGAIEITSTGGAANFSGIEIWKQTPKRK
ncbi:MAG: nucleoside hydrolase-like domain-containing protein [Planctomycetota bacterium]